MNKKIKLSQGVSPEFANYKMILKQYKSSISETATPKNDALCYAVKKKLKSLDNDIILMLIITQYTYGDKVAKVDKDALLSKSGYVKGGGTKLQQGSYSTFKQDLKWQGILIKELQPIMKDINTDYNTKVAWV